MKSIHEVFVDLIKLAHSKNCTHAQGDGDEDGHGASDQTAKPLLNNQNEGLDGYGVKESDV